MKERIMNKKQWTRGVAAFLAAIMVLTSFAGYSKAEGERRETEKDDYEVIQLDAQALEEIQAQAQLYESEGNYIEAQKIYQTMADSIVGEEKDVYQLNALRCVFLNGEYENALKGFETYIAEQSDSEDEYVSVAYFLKAACLMVLERYSEAMEGYEIAKEKGYEQGACLEQMMLCSFNNGDYKTTIELGNQMIDQTMIPAQEDVFYQRMGVAQMELEQYENAVSELTQSIEMKTNLEGNWYYRGASLMALERYEEARDDFAKSIEDQFLAQYCYFNRGVCHVQLSQLDEAMNDFKMSVTEGSDEKLIEEANEIIKQLEEMEGKKM